mgnify:CR=1 FL=1
MDPQSDWKELKVTVMGLGQFGGGAAAARFAAKQGAEVTVTDSAPTERLAESIAALEGVPIHRFRLGEHCEEDFRRADIVIVGPAVRHDNPYLQIARDHGARLTSEIELFMQRCPAPIIGITGTNGKSTTSAMIAHLLDEAEDTATGISPGTEADHRRRIKRPRTWLGGNIGVSLLDRLDEIEAHDRVVLELSSFQLYHLSDDSPRPAIAVVMPCYPSHLNWHDDFAHYINSKRRIFNTRQDTQPQVVIDASGLDGFRPADASCRAMQPLDDSALPELQVPGRHNRLNACCAVAAAEVFLRQFGEEVPDTRERFPAKIAKYRGLPGRLETVATIDGVRLINDTASTNPESVIAALEAIDRPWLIIGGASKGETDFGPLAEAIADRVQGVAVFGAIRESMFGCIHRILQNRRQQVGAAYLCPECASFADLAESLDWGIQKAEPGDTILFSPGFASFDQYRNFVDRGRHFRELVIASENRRYTI